jgi:Ca2+-dependent lipid-binding protein
MPITLVGDDGKTSKIQVQLKYIPIKMKLHPAESINNMGTLRCDILDASDLPAADRNGYSDPYCKIILNGQEVYKTATHKKTLNPKWNESFEIPVPSRTAAKFRIEVFDRDLGDKDDFLGAAEAQLQVLDPFQSQEVRLRLDGQSGAIRVKFLFRSDYVTRKRQGSGTFVGTFSSPSRLSANPAKGASKTASFFSRGLRRKTNGDIVSPSDDADFGTNNTPLPTIDSSEEHTGMSNLQERFLVHTHPLLSSQTSAIPSTTRIYRRLVAAQLSKQTAQALLHSALLSLRMAL